MEKQLFFSENPKLFGMLYIPEQPNGQAVLFVPPFAEEKKSSQRTMVEIGQSLSEGGCYVLLFDFRGCGDSDGNFEEAEVKLWLDDLTRAADLLRQESGVVSLTLIGIRLGGYFSLLHAISDAAIARLVLVETVLEPIPYLRQILRGKLIKELITAGNITSDRDTLILSLKNNVPIDFDGYPITGLFFKELSEREGKDVFPVSLQKKTTKIHITETERIPSRVTKRVESYKTCRHQFVSMPAFWNRTDSVDNLRIKDVVTKIICQ